MDKTISNALPRDNRIHFANILRVTQRNSSTSRKRTFVTVVEQIMSYGTNKMAERLLKIKRTTLSLVCLLLNRCGS